MNWKERETSVDGCLLWPGLFFGPSHRCLWARNDIDFLHDRMRKSTPMSLPPGTVSVTTAPPSHYSNSLPQVPQDAAWGSPTPQILPLGSLFLKQKNSFSPSLNAPVAAIRHTHARIPSIYSGIYKATVREARGVRRKEKGGHNGSQHFWKQAFPSLLCEACPRPTPKTLHRSREGNYIPGMQEDWTNPCGA